MKNHFLICLIVLSFLPVSLLFSLEPIDFPSLGPCGVMRMVANRDLLWNDEEPEEEESSLLGGPLFKIGEDEVDPTMGILLAQAEEIFLKTVGANTVMPLADKATVLASASYSAADEDLGLLNGPYITLPGYRFVRDNKPELGKAIAAENGLGGMIYVRFTVQTGMNSGVGRSGKCGGVVRMDVSICNAEGKTVFIKHYTAVTPTKKAIKVSFGSYKEDEMMALFPELFQEVCTKFVADIK